MNTITLRETAHTRPTPRHSSRSPARPVPRMVARVGSWVVLAVLLSVCALILTVLVLAALGDRMVVIKSGSMTPTLAVGDLVLSRSIPADHVREGDVVTFRSPVDRSLLITHRVVGVVGRGSTMDIVTKGDANTVPERWSEAASGHVGLDVGSIRYVGWWFELLQIGAVRSGIILLVCSGICAAAVPRIWAEA